jgi:hypothetical protein
MQYWLYRNHENKQEKCAQESEKKKLQKGKVTAQHDGPACILR